MNNENNTTWDLIIVGCGQLGAGVVEYGLKQGWKIAAIRRDINKLPTGVHGIAADLSCATDRQILSDLHCRYCLYTLKPFSSGVAGYKAAYEDAFLDCLKHITVEEHTFFVSSTSVYEQSQHEWVDESTPTRQDQSSGAIIACAEQTLLAHSPRSSCIRFGGIYGRPNSRMVEWVKQGECYDPAFKHHSNRIHHEDCVRVLCHLLNLAQEQLPLQSCYLAVDNAPATHEEVQRWLANALNVPYRFTPQKRPQAGSKQCANDRLLNSGFQFRYPSYQEGYKASFANTDPAAS